jgi:hypothetical protein
VVAYNLLAVVKATLRQVYGANAIDEGISGYYLVNEMGNVAESLETLVEPDDWAVFQTLTAAAMAAWLVETAGRVQLRKYRKHPRRPKKPPGKREIPSGLMCPWPGCWLSGRKPRKPGEARLHKHARSMPPSKPWGDRPRDC